MNPQVGQTISGSQFNQLYGVGSTVSAAQFNAKYNPSTPPPSYTPSESIWHGIVSYAGGVKNAFNGAVGQVGKGIGQISQGGPLGGLQGGLNIESGLASAITSPIAPIMKPVGTAISATENAVASIPAVQHTAQALPISDQALQGASEALGNVSNIAGTIAGAGKTGEVAPTVGNAVSSLPKTLKEAVTVTPEQAAATRAAAAAEEAARTSAKLGKVAQDWKRPTEIPTATFNKARANLEQAPGSPRFLAEQGLSPFSLIDNGRYSTTDTAQALRDTAGKLSADMLRPSLEAADATTPLTSINDIKNAAIASVKSERGVTAADTNTAIANINKEAAALKQKYPDGMSLTQMHDEKITYAQNGGYSPIKSASDNIKATANRSLGRVLGNMVEHKAPPELPVGDFNAYLSKYYKAADYLESLDTKKAPVSTAQYIAHKGAQVIGAGVGHAVGGGILGGVGGYLIGGALEHALENFTTPMRAAFLKNLEVTHPEVVDQVKNYLQSAPK